MTLYLIVEESIVELERREQRMDLMILALELETDFAGKRLLLAAVGKEKVEVSMIWRRGDWIQRLRMKSNLV